MEKIKKWRRFALALLSVLFVAIFSFALVQILPARAEETSVTIHADANGKVEYAVSNNQTAEGLTYTPVEAGGTSAPITISEGQFLHLKATVSEEKADDYLFQYWTTSLVSSGVVSSAVSMKIEDTFTFQELQEQEIATLYANFAGKKSESLSWDDGTPISNDKELDDAISIKIDENTAKYGDVYFFMANKRVNETSMMAHGIKLDPNAPFRLPITIGSDFFVGLYANAYYMAFFAVPKTDMQSSMDPDTRATIKFSGWTGTYYDYDSGSELSEGSGLLPKYTDGRSVGAFWKVWTTERIESQWDTYCATSVSSRQNDHELLLNLTTPQENQISWDFARRTSDLYINPTTLTAKFQEVPLMPKVSADKQEDDNPVEEIGDITNGQKIEYAFGHRNALTLYIEKIGNITKDDLSIMIDGVECHDQIQDIGGENFVFGYQFHQRATVTISYAKEDGVVAYSDFNITFHLEEVSAGTIEEDIIHKSFDYQ